MVLVADNREIDERNNDFQPGWHKKSTELLTVLVAENREVMFFDKISYFFDNMKRTELLTVLVAENREIQAQRKITGCGRSSVLVAFHVFLKQKRNRTFHGFGCREPKKRRAPSRTDAARTIFWGASDLTVV